MFKEDEFLQLSALQHFVFCPRQCALIHIEQAWEDNLFTAEGTIMHEKAHEEGAQRRKDVVIERGLPLRSLELGLNGKADVVEFRRLPQSDKLVPFPVEYKRGKPKPDDRDKVQLCAQALCLEEMLKTGVPEGALFYGKTKHRLNISFDENLRKETKDTAIRLHKFISEGKTPPPVYESKCDTCSLVELCMPRLNRVRLSVAKYLAEALRE